MRIRATALTLACCMASCSLVEPQGEPLVVTIPPEPEGSVWWARTLLEARATSMRGIPAGRLGEGWCRVAEFDLAAFPGEAVDGEMGILHHVAPGTSPFTDTGTFEARPLELVLGVQDDCEGGGGSTFLLVLDAARPGPPADRIVQVEKVSTRPVFMYLRASPERGIVSIPSCFRCDHLGIWSWDADASRFVQRDDLEPFLGD
jgi:hypothetical protein